MENKELLKKARQANSSEELLALAKENDVELTEEQSKELIDKLKSGVELSDDELDGIASGFVRPPRIKPAPPCHPIA